MPITAIGTAARRSSSATARHDLARARRVRRRPRASRRCPSRSRPAMRTICWCFHRRSAAADRRRERARPRRRTSTVPCSARRRSIVDRHRASRSSTANSDARRARRPRRPSRSSVSAVELVGETRVRVERVGRAQRAARGVGRAFDPARSAGVEQRSVEASERSGVSRDRARGSADASSYPGGMPRLRVAAAQINVVVGDLEGNAERVLDGYERPRRPAATSSCSPS